MKIAAAYVRVSTDNQIELSPDSQIKQIREYAKRNNMVVPDEFIFRDDGISGRSAAKRPEFNKMIGTAKKKPKPFDVILVWKFSRFARNREDSIVYKSMLRKQCGIDVVSISENVGDDKMSILIEAMIEAMDEYYSINLAEEVKRGMQEKFSRGQIVSTPPLGYIAKDGAFIQDANADLIRRIFDDFESGMGMRKIAQQLNAEGYKTKVGKNFENRTIEYILRNPVYTGMLRKSKSGKGSSRHFRDEDVELVQGSHEPIIEAERFAGVQKLIDAEKVKFQKYARKTTDTRRRPFVLQGLIRCSSCGGTLTVQRAASEGRYLQCYRYSHGKCSTSHCIKESVLTDRVIEELCSLVEERPLELNISFKQKRAVDNSAAIKREQMKLERVKQAYEAGVDTLQEYKENKSAILQRIDQLKAESFCPSSEDAYITLRKKIQLGLDKLRSADTDEEAKNLILREFIEQIIFNRKDNSIMIYYYI